MFAIQPVTLPTAAQLLLGMEGASDALPDPGFMAQFSALLTAQGEAAAPVPNGQPGSPAKLQAHGGTEAGAGKQSGKALPQPAKTEAEAEAAVIADQGEVAAPSHDESVAALAALLPFALALPPASGAPNNAQGAARPANPLAADRTKLPRVTDLTSPSAAPGRPAPQPAPEAPAPAPAERGAPAGLDLPKLAFAVPPAAPAIHPAAETGRSLGEAAKPMPGVITPVQVTPAQAPPAQQATTPVPTTPVPQAQVPQAQVLPAQMPQTQVAPPRAAPVRALLAALASSISRTAPAVAPKANTSSDPLSTLGPAQAAAASPIGALAPVASAAAAAPGTPQVQRVGGEAGPAMAASDTIAAANVAAPEALAGLPSPPVAAPSAPAGTAPTAPMPAQEFAALIDRLVEARQFAQATSASQIVTATVNHADFGQVAMQFQQDGLGLSVTVTSPDPDLVRAVQAAAPTGQSALNSDQGHAGQRQDGAAGTSANGSQAQAQQRGGQPANAAPLAEQANRPRPGAEPESDPKRGGIFA